MEDLDALRELTERIKQFPPVTKIEIGEEEQPICRYRLTSGETKAFNIFLGEEKICVDHWEAKVGSEFPWHTHNEKEWIIAYEGSGKVFYRNGDEADIIAGQCVFHDAMIEHRAEVYEDLRFVTIMIPASPDYPGAKGDKNGSNNSG